MMLDKQLLLTVCRIKGVVDIRYLNDDLRKTIRGVKLSTSQFQAITNNLSLIDEVFTNMRIEMRKNGGSMLLEGEENCHRSGRRSMDVHRRTISNSPHQKAIPQRNWRTMSRLVCGSISQMGDMEEIYGCVSDNIDIRNTVKPHGVE